MSTELLWGDGTSMHGEPYTMGYWPRLRVGGGITYSLRVADSYGRPPDNEEPSGIRVARVVHFISYAADDSEPAMTRPFDCVPFDDDRFAWAANLFFGDFSQDVTEVYVHVGSECVAVRQEELRTIDTASMVGPIWCPVANMVAERPYGPGGHETKRGTKHFAPGAKLYCDDGLWGDGYQQIQVVGHHRGSHRYVTMIVNSAWLTNWRVELAYSPSVIRALWPTWDGSSRRKKRAQEIVDMMKQREAAKSQP